LGNTQPPRVERGRNKRGEIKRGTGEKKEVTPIEKPNRRRGGGAWWWWW